MGNISASFIDQVKIWFVYIKERPGSRIQVLWKFIHLMFLLMRTVLSILFVELIKVQANSLIIWWKVVANIVFLSIPSFHICLYFLIFSYIFFIFPLSYLNWPITCELSLSLKQTLIIRFWKMKKKILFFFLSYKRRRMEIEKRKHNFSLYLFIYCSYYFISPLSFNKFIDLFPLPLGRAWQQIFVV